MFYINPEMVINNHVKNNRIPNWRIAIMCFHSIEKTRKIVEYFNGKCFSYRIFTKCNVDMVYEAEFNGEKIGIMGWCTGGGALVASLIEELKVTGVKWIIGIGSAASIVNQIKKNDMVIPTRVILNDGVSKVYSDKKVLEIDKDMYKIVEKIFINHKTIYHKVIGATVEAIYRQDEKMLNAWRKEGAEIVNWELGPFYAVSKKCGIRSIWIGHISDVETRERWQDWYSERNNETFLKILSDCKLIIELLMI